MTANIATVTSIACLLFSAVTCLVVLPKKKNNLKAQATIFALNLVSVGVFAWSFLIMVKSQDPSMWGF